jgi:FkbM family methyltransferase
MNLFYNKSLKKIVLRVPYIINLKRYLLAYIDSIKSTKKSYAQFKEDVLVMELLPNITPTSSIYIEVGANQPTQISNTYLFYRMGFNGIVIEPNRQMTKLFRHFRHRDIHLEIGCSDNSGVSKFKITDASVTSGFSDNIKALTNKHDWVPILTLDEVWTNAGESKLVFLLSIDTEGFDLHVLKGAKKTLENTACVIIETSEDDIVEINSILIHAGFKLAKNTTCNYIWINSDTLKKISQI